MSELISHEEKINPFIATADKEQVRGLKYDTHKPRMALVLGDFARAMEQVSALGTVGAIKYEDSNWLAVEDGEQRYLDALLRHLFAHLRGESQDEETGLSHLTAVAWNALAVLELQERD